MRTKCLWDVCRIELRIDFLLVFKRFEGISSSLFVNSSGGFCRLCLWHGREVNDGFLLGFIVKEGESEGLVWNSFEFLFKFSLFSDFCISFDRVLEIVEDFSRLGFEQFLLGFKDFFSLISLGEDSDGILKDKVPL